jgi:hypothetical protein
VRCRRLDSSDGPACQPVERALQDEDGGVLVDHLGAPRPADVGGDELALDRGGGEPLVPQADRQLGQARQVAREGAGRLRARTFAAVHVDREPEHKARCLALGRQRQQSLRISGKILARDRLDGSGKPPVGIAGGDADGLAAEVEADQGAARRQMLRRFDEGKDQCRHWRGLACASVRGHHARHYRCKMSSSKAITMGRANPKMNTARCHGRRKTISPPRALPAG